MEYLFHYTKPENAIKIIKDKTLLFNNINNTNDPYENKIFDMHVKSPDMLKNNENNESFDNYDADEEELENEKSEHEIYEYFFSTDDNSFYEKIEYSEEREEKFNKNLEEYIENIQDDYMPKYFQQLNDLKNGIVKTISFSTGTYYLKDISTAMF